jgi:N-acetylneuraminic acid mutarotase
MGATGWIDSGGKLWLFGGWGYDSAMSFGALNDLWVFDPSSSQWTWMSGSNIRDQGGTYGTKGTPSASNTPGGRYDASSWRDRNGNFWIFAGWGYVNNPVQAGSTILNDLWRYDPQ